MKRESSADASAPQTYPVGCCGSCRWNRLLLQFGVMKHSCTVMPRQVLFAPGPNGTGGQVLTVAPVIESPQDGCSMWAPPDGASDQSTGRINGNG